MIRVEEAIKIIKQKTKGLKIKMVCPIESSFGSVLAKDYHSPIEFPPFAQSAMDGYAVCFDTPLKDFSLIGEIKTGDDASNIQLNHGEAIRIFTGAMLPKNASAVIKQEDIDRHDNTIKTSIKINKNANIRPKGEQIQKGELAIEEGSILTPGAIGFLQMLGLTEVEIYKKPKILIVTTGSELIPVGNQLSGGKIYESNSGMLSAALHNYGFSSNHVVVRDSFSETRAILKKAIQENDLVLITGGISVGDYDFVGTALNDLEVEEGFYKVKQKPGKPLYFGRKNNTIIFGLPGNPASVLTSFYIYVLSALAEMTGRKSQFLKQSYVKLNQSFEKRKGLTLFLKGKLHEDTVEILPAQSSAMLSSFIHANCLIQLDEELEFISQNQFVKVYLID